MDLVAKKILILFWGWALVTFTPHPLTVESRNLNVVWNIGQGQWFTQVTPLSCAHFDAGGEHSVINSVMKLCANKTNTLFLSHWDYDHISFVGSLARRLSNICLINRPAGEASLGKLRLLKNLPPCLKHPNFLILDRPANDYVSRSQQRKDGHHKKLRPRSRANDLSQVAVAHGWLIPGDSPIKNEMKWLEYVPAKQVKFLLLGHHGSRTSTSRELLLHLNHLKVAVASSRSARYGHPHFEVRRRLSNALVPLLRTEDWGSIGFAE